MCVYIYIYIHVCVYIYTYVYIYASVYHLSLSISLFMGQSNWKQLKCPSTSVWRNKLFNNHTMGCYSAVKSDELLIHVTPCMNLNLKIIMPEKMSPHFIISFIKISICIM